MTDATLAESDDAVFIAEAKSQVQHVYDAYRAGKLGLTGDLRMALSGVADQLAAITIDGSFDPLASGQRDAACRQIVEMLANAEVEATPAAPGFHAPPAHPGANPWWPPPPPPGAYSPQNWAPPTLPPPRRRAGKTVAIIAGSVVALLVVLGVIGAIVGRNTLNASTHTSDNAAAVPVQTPTTPNGFTAFRSTTDQFTIDVPKTWNEVNPTSPGAQAVMNEIEQANPDLRSSFSTSAVRLAEQGIALMAINPVIGSDGFASNVNVAAKPDLTFSTSDLSRIAASLPTVYAKIGGTITGTSYVTLAGHQALRSTGVLSIDSPLGHHFNVDQTQYFVGANGFLYVLTLSGRDPNMAAIASSFSTN